MTCPPMSNRNPSGVTSVHARPPASENCGRGCGGGGEGSGLVGEARCGSRAAERGGAAARGRLGGRRRGWRAGRSRAGALACAAAAAAAQAGPACCCSRSCPQPAAAQQSKQPHRAPPAAGERGADAPRSKAGRRRRPLTASQSSQLGCPSWFRRVAAPSPVGPAPTMSTPTCRGGGGQTKRWRSRAASQQASASNAEQPAGGRAHPLNAIARHGERCSCGRRGKPRWLWER